jgi:hypothetical protein
MKRMLLSCFFTASFFFIGFATMAKADRLSSFFKYECEYRKLKQGLYLEISSSGRVSISPNQSFIIIQDIFLDKYDIYFLDSNVVRKFNKSAGSVVKISNDREVEVSKDGSFTVIDVYSLQKRKSPHSIGMERNIPFGISETLKDGRDLSITRLYRNRYVLNVTPRDTMQYEKFKRDIISGSYCGVDIAKMPFKQKQAIEPIVRYLLWDDLSRGKIADISWWRIYRDVITQFINMREFDKILLIYSYRIVDSARDDSVLSKVDPNKISAFGWVAVENMFKRAFKNKIYVEFTDVSVYQRNGEITLSLLGTQPLEGGVYNRFGFYERFIKSAKVSTYDRAQNFNLSWRQNKEDYVADIVFGAASNNMDIKPTSFPAGARTGLIVLDGTLKEDEISRTVDAYVAYFNSDGFIFAQRESIKDLLSYVREKFIQDPKIDYLVRDGHSDSEDDNLMQIYRSGYVIKGQKTTMDGLTESVYILFGVPNKNDRSRISEDEFAEWVERWHDSKHKSLVYLNTSCWGVEKTWVNLGYLRSSRVIEIASRTPVRIFIPSRPDATKTIIDGIRHGEAFESVRSNLRLLIDYSSGYDDNFIFPDQRDYPQATPIVKVHRVLNVRTDDGKIQPYRPNGYD